MKQKILKYSFMIILTAGILYLGVRYFLPMCRLLSTEAGREQLALFIENNIDLW